MAFFVNNVVITKQSYLVTRLPSNTRLHKQQPDPAILERDEKIAIEFNGNEHSHTIRKNKNQFSRSPRGERGTVASKEEFFNKLTLGKKGAKRI